MGQFLFNILFSVSKIFRRVACLFLVFISITLYGQSVPQTSQMIGYYPFYGNVNDSSGNNYDGTTNGAPVLTTDRFGNIDSAYALDGIDDYIYFGNAMYADLPDTDGDDYYEDSFSISIWAKSSESAEEAFITFGEASELYTGMIARIGSNISFNSSNWGVSSSALGNKDDGQWHQYVIVYRAGSFRKIYIDGSLIYQNNDSQLRFRFKNYGVSIGVERFNTSGIPEGMTNTYTGSVDEVRIWNVDLTDGEISDLYAYENNPANTLPPEVKTKIVNKNGQGDLLSSSSSDYLNIYGAIGTSGSVSLNGEIGALPEALAVFDNLAPSGTTTYINYPNISAWGQQFTPITGGLLDNVKINLYTSNSQTGIFILELWSDNGLSGTSALPSSKLATLYSSNWNTVALNTPTAVTFVTSFIEDYTLVSGTTYWLVVNQDRNGPAARRWATTGSGLGQTAKIDFTSNWVNNGSSPNLGAQISVSP